MNEYHRRMNEFAERLGFKLIRRRKHLIWKHFSGPQVVTSSSPSDYRALLNNKAKLRRVLKAAKG